MRKTRRAFERALAAAKAYGPAALAEVRRDFAEWLRDHKRFQEAYDLLRPVVEGRSHRKLSLRLPACHPPTQ